MRDLTGRIAILTGASRGIGRYLARALVDAGAHVALAARSAEELEATAQPLRARGARVVVAPTDVTDERALGALLERTERELGAVDVLVNNAGADLIGEYHTLSTAQIRQAISLNLLAPMLLTRLALPGMLERGRGHIVNIASMAAKLGLPYAETYSATKAGLVLFTEGIRAEYRRRGVSASVVTPGFVREAGMYERYESGSGVRAPRTVGTITPESVAAAVVRAVVEDRMEIIISPGAPSVLLALRALAPRAAEWVARHLGVDELFREVAQQRAAGGAAHGAAHGADPGAAPGAAHGAAAPPEGAGERRPPGK